MDFRKDPLTNTIYGDLKRGIEVTLEQCYFASALIILFSSIDILANLGRPADNARGREGFRRMGGEISSAGIPCENSGDRGLQRKMRGTTPVGGGV